MRRRLLVLSAVAVGALALAGAAWAAFAYVSGEARYRGLLEAGEAAMAAGDNYGAAEAFSGAIALRPTSMVAHYRRGEAYLAQRRMDQALRDLRQAARLEPDATLPLLALGRLHELNGEYSQAVDAYERAAAKLRSEDPLVLYLLALARYRGGSAANAPASAEKPLVDALARREAFPEAHYLLGLVRRDTNNIDGAIASLETAVRLAPEMVAAREELADLYRQLGRSIDEMRHLQALARDDSRPERRIAMAMAETRREQYVMALDTLKDAPLTDPRVQLAVARVHLAQAERTLEPSAIARAREVLEQALAGTAPRSEGLALYGRLLYLSGDASTAERMLKDAVDTTPVSPEAYAFLADAAERLSHDRDARDALVNLEALQGDTANAEVRAARARRIGALSLRANDARTALPYLQQAESGGHKDAATLGLLARAQWLTGDTAGAQETLSRALTLDPADPELHRLARAIR